MKILTKEEEAAHYSAVVNGGIKGGAVGLGLGLAGVALGSRRYAPVRNLTLQFKAFLVSSAATAGAIITAERASIRFGKARDPMSFYKDESARTLEEAREVQRQQASEARRALDWAREHRYTIVFSSWIAGVAVALMLVGRNRYLTTSQKVVQARVYAQGLTLAVLLATGALEVSDAKHGRGKWETVLVVDPDDPEHKHLIEKRVHKEEYEGQDLWKDMVAAEERRLSKQKEERELETKKAAAKNNAGASAH